MPGPNNRCRVDGTERQVQPRGCLHINDRSRVCFDWTDQGPTEVEITDYRGERNAPGTSVEQVCRSEREE